MLPESRQVNSPPGDRFEGQWTYQDSCLTQHGRPELPQIPQLQGGATGCTKVYSNTVPNLVETHLNARTLPKFVKLTSLVNPGCSPYAHFSQDKGINEPRITNGEPTIPFQHRTRTRCLLRVVREITTCWLHNPQRVAFKTMRVKTHLDSPFKRGQIVPIPDHKKGPLNESPDPYNWFWAMQVSVRSGQVFGLIVVCGI